MTDEIKNRSKQFIDTIIANMNGALRSNDDAIAKYTEAYKQYASLLGDYIAAKREYVAYIDKYQAGTEMVVNASLPGINSHLPSFTPAEMTEDTQKMQELGELVTELRNQQQMLESQIEKSLGFLVTNTHQIAALSAQASKYLDDLIVGMDSPYGSSAMTIPS